jgi:hypothetical protein
MEGQVAGRPRAVLRKKKRKRKRKRETRAHRLQFGGRESTRIFMQLARQRFGASVVGTRRTVVFSPLETFHRWMRAEDQCVGGDSFWWQQRAVTLCQWSCTTGCCHLWASCLLAVLTSRCALSNPTSFFGVPAADPTALNNCDGDARFRLIGRPPVIQTMRDVNISTTTLPS